jgi:O-antigen/teichoic acid export membrane protein
VNPFRNIIRLSVGDFLAKTLNFVAFVYLARVLGVASYGVLEFALSVLTYFLLLADGGLELWAIREAAQGKNIRDLVALTIPLRLLLAGGSFGLLLLLLPLFPGYPSLRAIMPLFGLALFAQAVNLKWVFMGQEKMAAVAGGLVVAQIVFAGSMIFLVNNPSGIIWVPLLRFASDLVMALYFLRLFAVTRGGLRLGFTLRGARDVVRPALTLGVSHSLAQVAYNFDSVLLGFILGAAAVGWYSAAYKPVTAVLAMPVTFFLGLFPVLSRTYTESREAFRTIVVRSLRLTSVFALPLGVGGFFLAEPFIGLLFGPAYANSVRPLQVLLWAAALAILRGTYRQALNSAGRAGLDLRCAVASIAVNVGLNLLFIPRYGIVGAAFATLISEVVWLAMASYYFYKHLMPVRLLPILLPPLFAAAAMGVCFFLVQPLFWVLQALIATVVYSGAILLLEKTEVQSWFQPRRA